MEQTRSVYRVEVSGPHCTVTARFGGTVITGVALDVSTAGLGATFQTGEMLHDLLPDLGELGELTITADWCRESVVVDARVVHRADTDGDLCLLGFEFTARPADLDPELNEVFNRRRTERVRVPSDRPVEVMMTAGEEFEVKGTLLDVSSTGASFEATVTSQQALDYTRLARVLLGLDPDDEPLQIPAIVRNRRFGDQSKVIYGVGFTVPASNPQLQMRIDAYVEQLQTQALSASVT